jgi:hypothetical protein
MSRDNPTAPLIHRIEDGARVVYDGHRNVAREIVDPVEARWLLQLAQDGIRSGRVLHLGGGFCVLAWLMGPLFDHTIVEIEPEFKQFCPPYAGFICADASTFRSDGYDIIFRTYDNQVMERRNA